MVDGTSAQLYFNDNVQRTLDDRATIRALHKQGIKVTLSILGNHQGAGLANFPSKIAAENFADQVAAAVKRYKLDGVDLDDEYSEYGNNGTGQPNDESIGWLISSLREDMPNKIISYYNIGPSAESLAHASPATGSQLTYATNPYYGTYSAPQIPGLDDSRLSAAAVDIQGTPASTAASLAQRTIEDGYGVFMTYNLPGGDKSDYISAFTEKLYGQATVYSPHASNSGKGRRGGCVTSLVDGVLYKGAVAHGSDRD